MANRAKRHVHKYHQVNTPNGKLWACALPDCNHHMPAHMVSMIPGKNSMCWGCDRLLILDEDNMKMDRPLCDYCLHKQKESIESTIDKPKLRDALANMGLFNEPTDDLDDLITKTFINPESK